MKQMVGYLLVAVMAFTEGLQLYIIHDFVQLITLQDDAAVSKGL